MCKFKRKSRFLCFTLRHDPGSIGVELDRHGWTDINTLVRRARVNNVMITEEVVREIVATDDKCRYTISPDGTRLRANYGHSVPVELDSPTTDPPARLFHGTARQNLKEIMAQGLRSQKRQFVHLSEDEETAFGVGRRHGEPVLLEIDATGLVSAGHHLARSSGGTWLAEEVPSEFIILDTEAQ